jgi:hypothetical protein
VYTILLIEHREPDLYGNSHFTQRRKGKSKGAKGKQLVFAVLFHLSPLRESLVT